MDPVHGHWLRVFLRSQHRATHPATVFFYFEIGFFLLATTWIGTEIRNICRRPRIIVGTPGRNRPSPCGDWPITDSSGYCPATVRKCIYPLVRCEPRSCVWPKP